MFIMMMAVCSAMNGASGWTIHEFDVSAYCTCKKCCGKFADGITASGTKAEGKLIAAPKSYRYGTEMMVPGYGYAVVEDRGGAIKSKGSKVGKKTLKLDRIDLLFPSHKEALIWGRQRLFVLVRSQS